MQLVEPAKTFTKDSIRLVKRCTKPDRKGKLLIMLIKVYASNENINAMIFLFHVYYRGMGTCPMLFFSSKLKTKRYQAKLYSLRVSKPTLFKKKHLS